MHNLDAMYSGMPLDVGVIWLWLASHRRQRRKRGKLVRVNSG
jgi:hypothetical protein